MRGFAIVLLSVTVLAALVPITSVTEVSGGGSVTVLGELYDYVIRGGVRVFIQPSSTATPGWLGSNTYNVTIDFHGVKYGGYLFSLSQAVDVSADGQYVALINYSVRPSLYSIILINKSSGGSGYEERSVIGIDWDLVIISGSGKKTVLSGTLPVSITEEYSGTTENALPKTVPEWGFPRVAFYGDKLYVLSVDIEQSRPVARPYIVNLPSGELTPLTGVSQPPPSGIMVPVGESVIVWFIYMDEVSGAEYPVPVLLGRGSIKDLADALPGYITEWAGTGSGPLIMSTDGRLYLIRPDAHPEEIGVADDFAVSPSGEWVAIASDSSGVGIYRAAGEGLDPVFSLPIKSGGVQISDDNVAFVSDDAVWVTTLPPNPETLARVGITNKYFTGEGGIRYELIYDDFALEGNKLIIIYHYSPVDPEQFWKKVYVLEEIPLPPKQGGLLTEKGGLRKVGECSVRVNGELRGAAYGEGVLVIATDTSLEAFSECNELWAMRFAHPVIDGSLNSVLFVHNNSLLIKVDMVSGRVAGAYYLPSNLGGYEPSYYDGRVLPDGKLVIEGLVPGLPFDIVIEGEAYELIPAAVTGIIVASDGVYSFRNGYLRGPNGAAALPHHPADIQVLDGGLVLVKYIRSSKSLTALLSIRDNRTVATISETVLRSSPAHVGDYPGALLLTYNGTYNVVLLTYTGGKVVEYGVSSMEKAVAAYGDGVLVTVVEGEGEVTATFYEVVPL